MRTNSHTRRAGFRAGSRFFVVGIVLMAVLGSPGCGSSTPSPGEAKAVVNQPSNPAPGGQPRSRTPRS